GRSEKFLRRPPDGPPHPGGPPHPPAPPARHRVVLGKAIDDHRLPTVRQRRLLRQAVGEAMVDFIGNQPQAAAVADRRQLRQPAGFQHGPRWIGGARHPQPRQPLPPRRRPPPPRPRPPPPGPLRLPPKRLPPHPPPNT